MEGDEKPEAMGSASLTHPTLACSYENVCICSFKIIFALANLIGNHDLICDVIDEYEGGTFGWDYLTIGLWIAQPWG
jgi:hypothetical protein